MREGRWLLAKVAAAWRTEGLNGLAAGVTRRAHQRTQFRKFQRDLRQLPWPRRCRDSSSSCAGSTMPSSSASVPCPPLNCVTASIASSTDSAHCYAAPLGDRIGALTAAARAGG